MIVGSLPFVHYLSLSKSGWKNLVKDDQVKWFLILITILVILVSFNLYSKGINFLESIRLSLFNVVSILTGTGYGTADFSRK